MSWYTILYEYIYVVVYIRYSDEYVSYLYYTSVIHYNTHSRIHLIYLHYSYIYIYAQLTLANVEAGETPITYKIATKSVPEWLQITPMLGTLRSLPPTLQHPLCTTPPLYNTPHFYIKSPTLQHFVFRCA